MYINNIFQNNFEILAPEIFIALLISVLLLYGLRLKYVVYNNINKINVLIINELIIYSLIIAIVLLNNNPKPSLVLLNGFFINNEFTNFINTILILSVILYFFFSKNYIIFNKLFKYEYSILILMSLLGLLFLSLSYNFISLYLSIELQSLCFYVLSVSNKKSVLSSEASLKYFILGAIASSFILYGSSIIYITTGSLNYGDIFNIISNINSIYSLNFISSIFYGLIFILSGLFLKIGAAPFHSWLPDVYEGSPNNITSFFAIVPKIVLFSIFIRFFFDIFNDIFEFFESIFYFCSLLSIIIGSFVSLQQKKIKRLLAYSSISHVGFMLICFVSNNILNIQHILLYLIVYIVMTINIWVILLSINVKKKSFKYLTDFTNLIKINPILTILLTLTLFSMAGIPPLSGFFSKMFIFFSALENSVNSLAVIGILLSVVSSFYYIRLIKISYFDNKVKYFLIKRISKINSIIIAFTSQFILFFTLIFDYILLYIKKISLLFLF